MELPDKRLGGFDIFVKAGEVSALDAIRERGTHASQLAAELPFRVAFRKRKTEALKDVDLLLNAVQIHPRHLALAIDNGVQSMCSAPRPRLFADVDAVRTKGRLTPALRRRASAHPNVDLAIA